MVRRFFEGLTNALEVLLRGARLRFRVSVPIAKEEKSFSMVPVDLGLFRSAIGFVRIARANVCRSRAGGEFHRKPVVDESTKKLSSGFCVPWPELLILFQSRQYSRLYHELLSRLADVETSAWWWRCPQALQAGSSCQVVVS